MVAHCLGITSPDPVKLDLYFERFLNPARATPPDIDTDLCSRRRDEVINYVYQRFGRDKVAMVCTINRFRRRSALRETASAFGFQPGQISKIMDRLPSRWRGRPKRNSPDTHPYQDLLDGNVDPEFQPAIEHAARLLGSPRHLSIHPGGIVISPEPITNLAPTQLAAKGIVITQFDLKPIERLGLVKIDLLGIRGLTVLGDVADQIHKEKKSGDSRRSSDPLDSILGDDHATSQLVKTGSTIGCFQIESPGMRATLREIEAKNMDDVLVALALYRPGPLTGGLKDAFVSRHKGVQPTTYLHTSLAPLLHDTYGVILYQEQVLKIAHELANFSLSESDLLRRAMSHFDPGAKMKSLKGKFLSGAYERHQVPAEVGEEIWDLMAAFAGYGFPKAHAASYAQVAWRSAWCKTHFPEFFMAAVLASWGGYYSQRVYLTEARRLGLSVLPPLVNFAEREFCVKPIDGGLKLLVGLDQVRDLTKKTQQKILRLRPFQDLDDFIVRVDPRKLETENLVRIGAFDSLGAIPDLLDKLETGLSNKGQFTLFPSPVSENMDWGLGKKVAEQERILGASIAAHPLELYSEIIRSENAISTSQAVNNIGKHVRVAGVRQIWRRYSTSRNERIYVMQLEDLEGMLDVFIISSVYNTCGQELKGNGPFIVEGIIEQDKKTGEPVLRAKKIFSIA